MFNKPDSKPNFFNLDQTILSWWKEKDILNKSIKQRPEDRTMTFYDGPITANGSPHHGHMLTFSLKDIIPRYLTMQGYRVNRSLGWDCQGLPVEYEVEKKLNFKEKKEIEEFGIAEFNKLCRESVLEYRDNIVMLEEKMGRLSNSEEEYATMDKNFIESIWWSLKELFDKGLLYEGFKVVPYSTRAGTVMSNAEVALGGYKNFVDPAITVEFPLKNDPSTALLAWTTTPWTIPTNLALAIGENINYVKVKLSSTGKYYILAEALVEKVLSDRQYEIVENLKAEQLVGIEYIPPFDLFAGKDNAHRIYLGEHVTTESGTGIVHLAPYGAEDNDIFQQEGIESFDVLDDQGDFTALVPMYFGINYREANSQIIEDLNKKGALFVQEEYEHEVPMCWRTNTPLIYKPITSWYIGMSRLRNELTSNNNKINWVPSHVKDGRFGNWLAEIKDWAISRKRYWGTPLPIWKSASGKVKVFGSYEELEELTGSKVDDPHRPYIDEFAFELDGEKYTRVSDVLDVWYDSGAMPFARFHYPFENKEKFDKKFPADFISESVDQTRGWFYSLHAIATALFDSEAFKNVVMSGFVLDDNGVKLSKSKKNYTAPDAMLEQFGADTIRMNFFSTPISAGEDTTISVATLRLKSQEVMVPLWNIFSYLITYANTHNWKPTPKLAYNDRYVSGDEYPWDHIPFGDIENELDAWLLCQLQTVIAEVTKWLNEYNIPKATRSLTEMINHISKWYIRRSRERFVTGDETALSVLYYVFIEYLKLAAPFMPFITEYMYQELVADKIEDLPISIHLCDYPVVDNNFLQEYSQVIEEMEIVRQICDLGQALRGSKNIKVRQPLAQLLVTFSTDMNSKGVFLSDWMKRIIMDELNVLSVKEVPNLDGASEDFIQAESIDVKVALDINITTELAEAGTMREVIRTIQALRKNKGLELGQKVDIQYFTPDSELAGIIISNTEKISQAVGASSLTANDSDGEETAINGKLLRISLLTK